MEAREKQLNRLCSGETFDRARSLMKQVDLLCAPGTGYAVPVEGRVGLPAVCAIIASEELNNTDVREQDARKASCVTRKIFDKTYDTVQNALKAHYKKMKDEERGMFYEQMIREHRLPHIAFLRGQMEVVAKELISTRRLRRRGRTEYDAGDEAVSVAIFLWVCTKCRVLKKRGISAQTLAKKFNVDPSQVKEIFEILEGTCEALGEDIWKLVQQLRNTTPSASPTKKLAPPRSTPKAALSTRHSSRLTATPSTTTSRPASPVKSALRSHTSLASVDEAGAETPTRKRNVAFLDFDAESDPEETPTKPWKRRRTTAINSSMDMTAFRAAVMAPHIGRAGVDKSPPPSSTNSTPPTKDESIHSDDADDERSVLQSQSDVGSEAEVESYVEMDVPLNDTDDDASSDGVAPDSEASGPEEPLEADLSRGRARIARVLPASDISPPRIPIKKSKVHVSPVKATSRSDQQAGSNNTPKRASKSHGKLLDIQSSESESEADPAPRRRCRPVLLGFRQWTQRDPRLEKQVRVADGWKAKMVEEYGVPNALETLTLGAT